MRSYRPGVDLSVLILLTAAALALVDRDLEFVLEPDFDVQAVTMFRQFLHTLDVAALAPPHPHPYFDGAKILYALVAEGLRPGFAILRSIVPYFASQEAQALAAGQITNAVAYALGCWAFYFTAMRLGASRAAAAVLASLVFLSPQMVDINMARLDFLMMGGLLVILRLSVEVLYGTARPRHGLMLGAVLAFVSAVKLNGIGFAFVPVSAALVNLLTAPKEHKLDSNVAFAAVIAFLAIFGALMLRYWHFVGISGFPQFVAASVQSFLDWSAVMSKDPALYYSFDALLPAGPLYLAVLYVAVAAVALDAAMTRNPASVFLLANILAYTALGVISLKYQRGGYHLVPFYIAALPVALARLQELAPRASALRHVAALVVLLAALPSAVHYASAVHEVGDRAVGVQKLRREPRQWLARNLPPQSRICILRHSDWVFALPSNTFKITYGPFDIPYLSPQQLREYRLPSADELRRTCDAVMFNDFHVNWYLGVIAKHAPAQHASWKQFLEELRLREPPATFSSREPSYGVSRVEIYDLTRP